MLLNLTNHPSARWGELQTHAALVRWQSVVDLPFPPVPSTATPSEVETLAQNTLQEILAEHPDAVLCQGEMSLTVALVALLHAEGLPVYAACSERSSQETVQPDGTVQKTSIFQFVQFRAYPPPPNVPLTKPKGMI